MLNHVVLFWGRGDLTAAERADLEAGLRSLLDIPLVTRGTVGSPVDTKRAVVDGSYTFALSLVFPDVAAHDAYQVHPVHNAFHDRCKRYWERVVVYDFS